MPELYGAWHPSLSIEALLASIQYMLVEPYLDPAHKDDIRNYEAYDQYFENCDLYKQKSKSIAMKAMEK